MTLSIPHVNGKKDMAKNLRDPVEQADQFLSSTAHSGDQKFDAVRDQFSTQVRQMRNQLDDLEASVVNKARRAARSTDQAIHAHPYGAMGLVAAASLLIGLLAARR